MIGDDATTAGPTLTVRLPELPVSTYLRWLAWWHLSQVTLLTEPTIEAIAKANGVHATDRDIQLWVSTVQGAVCKAAAIAAERGDRTVSPDVTASMSLWREYVAMADRRTEWLERVVGSPVAEQLPYPSPEVLMARAMFRDAIVAALKQPEARAALS